MPTMKMMMMTVHNVLTGLAMSLLSFDRMGNIDRFQCQQYNSNDNDDDDDDA